MDENKNKELTDEQLEQVTGGFVDHGDGTYSFVKGDCFTYVLGNDRLNYNVLENYDHLTLNDWVLCEHIHEKDGEVFNWTSSRYMVKHILRIY